MHSFTHHHRLPDEHAIARERGVVTISAWFYDLMTRWFVMHGKERAFRLMIANQAQLQPGEAVLDVGCGTGTLALVAKERVGEMGRVCGIDPSVQLLIGACRKAKHAGLSIDFQSGGIEQIPFPNQTFDVVMSTFMMHHVPDDLKRQGLSEVARVLKAEGRLLIVDFKRPDKYQGRPGQFGVGEIGLQELPALMKDCGFSQTEIGEMPFRIRSLGGQKAGHQNYGFVLARKSLVEEKMTIV